MGEASSSRSNRESAHRATHSSRHHKHHHLSSGDESNHRSKSRRKDSTQPENPISKDDYFRLSSEFRIWLHEHKKIFFDELKSDETHKYFGKFVKKWNSGKLEKKYYEGIRSSQVDPAALTKYKWNFKGKGESSEKLEQIRTQIDRATNKDFAMEVKMIVNAQQHAHVGEQHKRRAPQGPTMPPPATFAGSSRRHGRDEDMDDEDKAGYNHWKRKKDEKSHKKSREADLEELAPKATGRDAVLEKRRIQTAYHRRERDDGMEVPESVLMGGDDYQARLATQRAKNERKQQRVEQKREEMSEKVESYNNKEAATMAMLRQLAEASRASGVGLNARK